MFNLEKFLFVPAKNSMWEEEIAHMYIYHPFHIACKVHILFSFVNRTDVPSIHFHLVHLILAIELGGEGQLMD